MKIIIFTKYTEKGASSRMRSYQYISYLQENGIDVTVAPLFPDEYLDQLYSVGKVPGNLIIKSYIQRFIKLFSLFKYDKVIIEKELFPYLPAWTEILLSKLGVKYMVDYDDAIFHNYDLHPKGIIRFFLGNKIKNVIRSSSLVTVGNQYLAEYAKNAGASSIRVIPTTIDLERYQTKVEYAKGSLVIGWIGTASTLKYLSLLKEELRYLIDKYNVKIYIIGAKDSLELGKNEYHIDWSLDTEVPSILQFDIGIMPLANSPWAKGKCAYKLIQYMACGIPVIASPVGMNSEVVSPGKNGYLAHDATSWIEKLEMLIQDQALRKKLGYQGRKDVEEKFTLQVNSRHYLSSVRAI